MRQSALKLVTSTAHLCQLFMSLCTLNKYCWTVAKVLVRSHVISLPSISLSRNVAAGKFIYGYPTCTSQLGNQPESSNRSDSSYNSCNNNNNFKFSWQLRNWQLETRRPLRKSFLKPNNSDNKTRVGCGQPPAKARQISTISVINLPFQS